MLAAMVARDARDDESDWPWVTIALSAVILLFLTLEYLLGLDTHAGVALARLGATEHGAVFEGGEVWRLLGSPFLHAGLLHVLFNGWALVQLGAFFEGLYGRTRLIVVYFLAAIGSSLLSSATSGATSVGASGAIMGLVGFLVVARYAHPPEVRDFLKAAFGQRLLFWGGVTLALGAIPWLPIDNRGHVGGVVTGLVLGLVIRGTGEARLPLRALAAGLVVLQLACFAAIALLGGETARIESALERAEVAVVQSRDPVGARLALDEIAAVTSSRARVVGLSFPRAVVLTEAAIAAGRPADALVYGEAGARLEPVMGHAYLGHALLASGDRAGGEMELRAFRAAASPEELEAAGQQLAQFEEWGPAVSLLELALVRSPDEPAYLNGLAWTLLTARDAEHHDPARALWLARRAALAVPTDASILDTLAEAESQLGLHDLAIGHERVAVKSAHEKLDASFFATSASDERLVEELERHLDRMRARSP
jgi:membrane associated rhomboid family serine protease